MGSDEEQFNKSSRHSDAGNEASTDGETAEEKAAKEAARAAADLDPEGASQTGESGESGSGGSHAVPDAEKPEDLTPEQLKDLKEKAAKAEQFREEALRQRAEYENLRKRVAREREDAVKYANEKILEKLLPILDNFEMALKAAENKETATIENLHQGVKMIYTQLSNLLEENGLTPVHVEGRQFDPKIHEALSQEASSEVPEGNILYQVRKGYKLRDRLLRPASVVVAKSPQGGEAEGSDSNTQSGSTADGGGSAS